MNEFNQDYLDWKGWQRSGGFGRLRKHWLAYYDAEVRRTQLAKIAKVLEVGFGNGEFLAYARQRGWDVLGLESNEMLVERAVEAGFSANSSSEIQKLPEESYDLVAAFDVLEHINPAEIRPFLDEIYRVLKPGGTLLARFPNGDSPLGLPNQNGDITHVNSIGSAKAHQLAKACGFSVVFVGAEARPLCTGRTIDFVYGLVLLCAQGVLEAVVGRIFFPNRRVFLFSPNLVIVLRRPVAASA